MPRCAPRLGPGVLINNTVAFRHERSSPGVASPSPCRKGGQAPS